MGFADFMQLDKIITLANRPVRLRFLAMERSLRAVGCDLPLKVIPYNADRFDLPPNASWWEMPSLLDWLHKEKAHPTMAKYQCLTVGNYQFVDADVIFLRNPAEVLASQKGFITSCCHWRNPGDATTPESIVALRSRSTVWQKFIFNTGQYACDEVLYTEETLREACLDPRYANTSLRFKYHEQPGLVLLVHNSAVPVYNLTLPPVSMESTWAGDYPDENFTSTWGDPARKPYIIHWAGCSMHTGRPIDRLFTDFLTKAEQDEWHAEVKSKAKRQAAAQRSPRGFLRKIKRKIGA